MQARIFIVLGLPPGLRWLAPSPDSAGSSTPADNRLCSQAIRLSAYERALPTGKPLHASRTHSEFSDLASAGTKRPAIHLLIASSACGDMDSPNSWYSAGDPVRAV
jgi:hypothetical protein